MWCHSSNETHKRAIVADIIPYLRHQIRQGNDVTHANYHTIEDNKHLARHLYWFFSNRKQLNGHSIAIGQKQKEASHRGTNLQR